jgi:hypothetical protein
MQAEAIKKNLNGKTAVALNLTDGITERVVKNARQIIAEITKSKEAMRPAYEEKKIFYLQVKKEFDEVEQQWNNLDEEIKSQMVLVDTFVKVRKNKEYKVIKVLKEPEKRNGTKAAKRVAWLKEAHEILEKQNKFMTPEEVYCMIIEKPSVKDQLSQMSSFQKNPAGTRFTTTQGFIDHATTAAKRLRTNQNFNTYFLIYNEKIGLPEWLDNNHVPLAKYMKEFMHKN